MSTHPRTQPILLAGALSVILLLPGPAVRGEVSVDARTDLAQSFIVMSFGGGGDDPTPWPTWQPTRQAIDPRFFLNPEGDAKGDGRPAFALSPDAARPAVVWSRWDGFDREILLSEWDGIAWTPARALTDNLTDDDDPRIAFARDGSRHVVWEASEAGELRVWYRQPAPGPGKVGTEPELVTEFPDTGRFPDVAIDEGGVAWVSYQQDARTSPGAPVGVFVARRDGPFLWTRQRVGPTGLSVLPPDADRGARIHAARGKVWVDWIDGPGMFAYRVWNVTTDGWSKAERYDYGAERLTAGHEEMAREMARQRIRDRVLNGRRGGPGPI